MVLQMAERPDNCLVCKGTYLVPELLNGVPPKQTPVLDAIETYLSENASPSTAANFDYFLLSALGNNKGPDFIPGPLLFHFFLLVQMAWRGHPTL